MIESQSTPRGTGTPTVTTRPATPTLRAALVPTSTEAAAIVRGTRIVRGNVTTSEPPTRRPHCSSVRGEMVTPTGFAPAALLERATGVAGPEPSAAGAAESDVASASRAAVRTFS
jgi:hypothetical protein